MPPSCAALARADADGEAFSDGNASDGAAGGGVDKADGSCGSVSVCNARGGGARAGAIERAGGVLAPPCTNAACAGGGGAGGSAGGDARSDARGTDGGGDAGGGGDVGGGVVGGRGLGWWW